MNQTQIGYQGLVEVKYLIHGKEVRHKGHNKGLNAMFKYLCKLLTGDTRTISADSPTFLDVRLEWLDAETEKFTSKSCLYNLISISNPEYYFDTTLSSWVTRFTIVLSYNMINFELVNNHPEATTHLYIKSASGNDFAELVLDERQVSLSDIVPGTQALVQWTMLFKNISDSEE